MTCIVAVKDSKGAWMGCDSLGVAGYDVTVRTDRKIFERGPFLFGFTSSYRMGQIIRTSFNAPKHEHKRPAFDYMAGPVVDALRACLKSGGYTNVHDNVETGGSMLVLYRGQPYCIEQDFQVGMHASGFYSVGCGESFALGALHALKNRLKGKGLVLESLRIAELLSCGVRRPFHIVRQNR